MKWLLILMLLAAPAWATPLYPITVAADGTMTIHREPQPPPTFFEQWFTRAAEAAGFNMPGVGSLAYGWDGTSCTNTGTYASLTVPRCASNVDGSFYIAFGMPSTPSSAPSFTMQWDVNNSGGETTAARHWCYRASCGVASVAGSNVNTVGNLSFGTASALADNTFANSCNAANKLCSGATTASFTCNDNSAAACSGTACNNHLTVIKVEPRSTSCTAVVSTLSLDYGHFVLVEAN